MDAWSPTCPPGKKPTPRARSRSAGSGPARRASGRQFEGRTRQGRDGSQAPGRVIPFGRRLARSLLCPPPESFSSRGERGCVPSRARGCTNMASTNHQSSGSPSDARPALPDGAPSEAKDGISAATADQVAHPDRPGAPTDSPPAATPPEPSAARPPRRRWRKWLLLALAVVGVAAGGHFLIPWVETTLNTVSTDDAYVNGHVTFVAPRVSGQVARVLVDDNYRVKKGTCWSSSTRSPSGCRSR
jgi:hypothetical protein